MAFMFSEILQQQVKVEVELVRGHLSRNEFMGWDGIYSEFFFRHPLAVKQKLFPVKIGVLPELLCRYKKCSHAGLGSTLA